MSTEVKVAEHYTRGRLEESVLQGVKRAGKTPENLVIEDFAGLDQFHVGGLEATRELASQMNLRPGLRLLDVGCGIGGPARYFAGERGCQVTGIDVTEEFVEVAKRLTKMLKLEGLVEFQKASALNLPFELETFDRASMIHVGMNIADKAGLFREVRRVLKSGGLFAVFDVVRTADGPIRYPVPWALDDETSFVADLKNYRDAMESAGFRVDHVLSQKTSAVEATKRAMARMAQDGPPVLGLQLLMGEKTQLMVANVLVMMQDGLLEPVEMIGLAV
jgi:ubiquinone/menaquinone biosynthesis C-methylase UbiE